LDGRSIESRRPVTCTPNSLRNCPGSALLAIGRTIVVTRLSATPQPIAPSVSVCVSRSCVSSIKGAVATDKALTAMIRLLTTKVLPLDQLEIARPDPHNPFQTAVKLWAWHLGIQITVISDDGGLEVAAILSVQEALQSFLLPGFDLDEEGKLFENGQMRTLNVRVVSGLRFAACDGKLVYDPTYDEEKVADGCCTMVMSVQEPRQLMKLTTSGKFDLNEAVIAKMAAACSL
jgi:exosome complex RNA-binding protein Rrp42 (RNase PH superfamily)